MANQNLANQACAAVVWAVDQAKIATEEDAQGQVLGKSDRRSFYRSIFFIVMVAFLLRLAVITIGHTYRITPRRDHFQFGWEMGRLARSVAQGQRFISPTDLNSTPSPWTASTQSNVLAVVLWMLGLF